MSGRRRRALGIVAAAGLVAAAVAVAAGGLSRPAADVPLHTVAGETFRRRVVAEGNLRAAAATPIVVPSEVWGAVRLAWMVPEGESVAAGEVVARLDPTELERNLVDAGDQRTTADLRLARAAAEAEASRRNLERDAELAAVELEHVQGFQRKDDLVFSRLEIVESEVDEELSRQRRDHAEQEKGIRGSLARTERELLEVERRKADLAWDRAATGLRLLEITAPHAGFVVRERGWRGQRVRVGDTVWRGQKLGELPDLAKMQAEVWVLEADAGGVAAGQRARVVVESRPGAPLEGTVARVDAVPKPRVPASPVQYFGVTLDLAEAGAGAWKPGQRVRAEILVEEREEALVVPRQAVFEGEGSPVVYVWQGRGGFTTVPVTLGPMTAAQVVVTAGVAAGDRIALRDPHREPDEGASERPAAMPAPTGDPR